MTKKQIMSSEILTWDQTAEIYSGIWEMTTPYGRVFRVDLGNNRGLGFYAHGRIRSSIESDWTKAWEICQKCTFRRVTTLHKATNNP